MPVEDKYWDVLIAAKVVSVIAIAITTNAITAVDIESFRFTVFYAPYKRGGVLSLNKYFYF